ncbi:MAG: hypothetical protein IMZ53_00465 [Thermoplasmata archaeon]|nr:hypothetical protein [Thermoplasmata archaeon]
MKEFKKEIDELKKRIEQLENLQKQVFIPYQVYPPPPSYPQWVWKPAITWCGTYTPMCNQ